MMAIFITHFWEFFFVPKGKPWFEGNVWGNMVAWVVCGGLAFLWLRSKHIAAQELAKQHHAESMQAHAEAAEKHEALLLKAAEDADANSKKLLDALDTTTPGGLTDVLTAIRGQKG